MAKKTEESTGTGVLVDDEPGVEGGLNGGLALVDEEIRPDQDKPYTSSESLMQADPKDHLKGIKRAPNHKPDRMERVAAKALAEGETFLDPHKPMPVPTPPHRLFKTDPTNKSQSAKIGLNWWNALPTWAKNHVEVYVYREHPVLLEPPKDDDGKPKWYKYIDKISGTEPLQDELDMLNRYGCGTYRLDLNEVLTKAEMSKSNRTSGRTLCQIYINNVGGGDYKSNPPTDKRVGDVSQVDLTHPANQAYVAYLRGTGSLPSQIDNIKKEMEMAQVSAVSEANQANVKLVDKVIEMADRASAKPASTDLSGKAMETVLETMSQAHAAAINVVKEANEYAAGQRERVSGNSGSDPMELALKIVAMLNSQRTNTAPSDEVRLLREEIDRMKGDRLDALEKTLAKVLDKLDHPPAPTTLTSVKDNLQAMKEAKKALQELGDDDDGPNPAMEVAKDMAPPWLRKYAPLIEQGMGLLTAWMMKSNQAQYPGMMPATGMMPGMMPGMPPPGFPMAPGQFPGSPAPNPAYTQQQPQQQHSGPQPVPMQAPVPMSSDPVAGLLTSIAYPLKRHMEDPELGGVAFADWFIGGFGEAEYKQVAEFGAEQIIRAMYTVPATAQIVSAFPPQFVQGFVKNFCDPQFETEDNVDGAGQGAGEDSPVGMEPDKTTP